MKLLLDTHVFLWYITGDPRLPAAILPMFRSEASDVYLRVVSIWEILVKYQIGKLGLPQPPESYATLQRRRHGFRSLPLDEGSVMTLVRLPLLHRDPFDRMLVCQAIHRELTIVSVDPAMRSYSAQVAILP